MDLREIKLSSEVKNIGRVVTMYEDQVRLPNGKVAGRDVVRHPGAVIVVPVLPDGRLVLVEQYRYPVDTVLLELPAGKLDAGEEPQLCAQRELEEETGYRAQRLTSLGKMFTTPGFCDEVIHVYKAEYLLSAQACPDEDEFLNTKIFTIEELRGLVRAGTLCDSKTITALFYAGYSL